MAGERGHKTVRRRLAAASQSFAFEHVGYQRSKGKSDFSASFSQHARNTFTNRISKNASICGCILRIYLMVLDTVKFYNIPFTSSAKQLNYPTSSQMVTKEQRSKDWRNIGKIFILSEFTFLVGKKDEKTISAKPLRTEDGITYIPVKLEVPFCWIKG